MNIFMLDSNPFNAARMHCDKHVVKMVLESAQMLSTAHHVLDGKDCGLQWDLTNWKIYKATHKNHPSNVWVRETRHNYGWLYQLFVSLLREYKKRYNKTHKCEQLVEPLWYHPIKINRWHNMTHLPQCMPDQYKVAGLYDDPLWYEKDFIKHRWPRFDPVRDCWEILQPSIEAYRNYYKAEKSYFAKWEKGTSEPAWWKEQTINGG